MSAVWKTKHGYRKVKQSPPDIKEAIEAARDISDDPAAQAEIAAALMGMPVEDVKREAEAVVAWLKENGGDKRAEENFQPATCSKNGTETWKGCIAALTAEDGPFAGKKSAFEKSRDFFAPKCDMNNPETVGSIIIERGAVPLGSTSLSYSAFDGSESLAKDLTIRVIVCGRGFHLIKVATEITF
mgnify:CR=1 FL=1